MHTTHSNTQYKNESAYSAAPIFSEFMGPQIYNLTIGPNPGSVPLENNGF